MENERLQSVIQMQDHFFLLSSGVTAINGPGSKTTYTAPQILEILLGSE
ncbi:MAG: hypothetical protein WBG48_00020 [Pricia sp.]